MTRPLQAATGIVNGLILAIPLWGIISVAGWLVWTLIHG